MGSKCCSPDPVNAEANMARGDILSLMSVESFSG